MAAATAENRRCCYTGFKHEGTAAGGITDFGGYKAYVTYPEDKSTERAVVILGDVLGIELINSQLVADEYAKRGYFVVMPDMLHGDWIQLNQLGDFNFQKWLAGDYSDKKIPHNPETVEPVIKAVLKELREKYGTKKIAGAGYCFGARYACRFLADTTTGFQAGYFVHPGELPLEEVESVKGPIMVAAAEHDPMFTTEKRRQVEDILLKSGLPFQTTLYQGVRHGFAIKGDPKDKAVKYAKENTFEQAVSFFDTWL